MNNDDTQKILNMAFWMIERPHPLIKDMQEKFNCDMKEIARCLSLLSDGFNLLTDLHENGDAAKVYKEFIEEITKGQEIN
jgi:hypothetical protein